LKDGAEETNDDWARPPSPPPEDRLPKRSKLDDLEEVIMTPPLPNNSNNSQLRGPLTYEYVFQQLVPVRPPINNPFRGPNNDVFLRQLLQMDQARVARLERKKAETAAIIAAAAAAQQAEEQRVLLEAAAAAEARSKEEERLAERERRLKERKERENGGGGQRHGGDEESSREKRLLKLVGAVVVKTMSKYRARMDVETFKKHAKELTHIIAEKEKKSSSYNRENNKLEALSDDKKAKIKKFAREYIHKVLHRLERGNNKHRHPPPDEVASASATATATPVTPQRAAAAVAADMPPPLDDEMDMSADEAMDLSPDEEEDEDDEPTPVDVEPAESDTSTAVAAPADPRLRARATSAAAAATTVVVSASTKEWELLEMS